jgi:aminocarboxymuconate-semialdehyde decarboxylase
MARTINVHSHFQPEEALPLLEQLGIGTWEEDDEVARFIRPDTTYEIPVKSDPHHLFWGRGLPKRVELMDAAGVDVTVLMPSPMNFNYEIPAADNDTFSHGFNDAVAGHLAGFPDRFWAVAQLPMQDLELAAKELTRAVVELGFAGCAIGYEVGWGRTLADPECDAFLSTVEELDVPILLHPVALGQSLDLKAAGGEWLLKNQLDWAWGYLFVESAAVVGMIFGGTLDRHPKLRVMVPHGGGMIPYQIGRLKRFAEVYRGPSVERATEEYLRDNFWFDTVVHDRRALELLVDVIGEDNVVMGSNFPGWDDFRAWDLIREARLTDQAKQKILGENAERRLFGANVGVGR